MHPHAPRPTDPDVKPSYRELPDAPHPYMGYNDRLEGAPDPFTGYNDKLPGGPDLTVGPQGATYASPEGGLDAAPNLWESDLKKGAYRERMQDAPDVLVGYSGALPDAPDRVLKVNTPGGIRQAADAPDEAETPGPPPDAPVTEAPEVTPVTDAPDIPRTRTYAADPAPPSARPPKFSAGSHYSIPFAGQTRIQTTWSS